jgi:hypothetical protein
MQNRHVMNLRRRLAIYKFTSSNGELDPHTPCWVYSLMKRGRFEANRAQSGLD